MLRLVKALLIVDNHASHLDYGVVKFCKEHYITGINFSSTLLTRNSTEDYFQAFYSSYFIEITPHEELPSAYPCQDCSKSCSKRKLLQNHIKKSLCSKEFKDKNVSKLSGQLQRRKVLFTTLFFIRSHRNGNIFIIFIMLVKFFSLN